MNRIQPLLRLTRAVLVVLGLLYLSQPDRSTAAEIYINEIMADNSTNAPMVDFPDYTPDYVELYNASGRDIDLGAEGWNLTTKVANTPPFGSYDFKDFYFFRSGEVFPAESYLLVFFDNDTNLPGVHATMNYGGTNGTNVTLSLSRRGDRVTLYKGGDLLPTDSVLFGPQVPNLSIGRVPDAGVTTPDGDNFTLNLPTPYGVATDTNTLWSPNTPLSVVSPPSNPTNVTELTLKINEWVAFSLSGSGKTNDDWVEIYNPDTNIVELSGLWLVDKDKEFNKPGNQIKPHSFISPLAWVQFFADSKGDAADAVDFSLSSTSGDEIYIFSTNQTTIINSVIFGSLATPNVSRGRVPDGGDTIITLQNQSPEDSNFGPIPEVVISEVLPHTDPPYEDAIELQNVTSSAVNIGNWWLSNSRNNGRKYRIPASDPRAVVPPGGFAVFYEKDFNNPSDTTYNPQPFTLNSANGDECYLFKGDSAGKLTGFRRGISFGPSANGVPFIRHVVTNTLETNVSIVAGTRQTFGTDVQATDSPGLINLFRLGTGSSNSQPVIGPIVINEIYYHPPEISTVGGPVDDDITEYVELYNASESTVLFYDPGQYFVSGNYNPAPDGTVLHDGDRYADGRTNTWRMRGGISFNFPQNVSLAAGKFMLLVNFDPANSLFLQNFTNTFPALTPRIASGDLQLFGPYSGKLSNKGADIEIRRPDIPQGPIHPDFRLVPFITIDLVKYNDKLPWPIVENTNTGGGTFQSIQKINSYDYGNDPLVWFGGEPTPGAFNSLSGIEPPSIATQPVSVTTTAGKNVTLSVTARGGTPLQYQWYTNGVAFSGRTTRTLAMLNVTSNNNAAYTVVVTNFAGAVTSTVATLTVNPPIADSILPLVKITTPAYTTTTNLGDYIRGTASDKNGINNVYFSVNGGQFLAVAPSDTYAIWASPAPVLFADGTNVISAYSVDQAGNNSLTNTRVVFRSSRTPLLLSTNGSGSVKGATNGQMLELGRNLLLTATPAPGNVFSNWIVRSNVTVKLDSSSPTLSYLLHSNTVVTANFVPSPYIGVAGKYQGLFLDETNGVQHGSSGHFLLTTTPAGTYSATLLTAGLKLSATGKLDLNGRATNSIVRKGTNNLLVTWHVLFDGSDIVTGTVSDGVWTAALEGDRATFTKTNPCTYAGKYTALLPGLPGDAFVPGGTSYGTVTIDSNGVVTLKGFLSDKTGGAQKGQVSRNGHWPLYIPLYSKKGSILSWVTFEDRVNDDFHGDLNWSKPPLPGSKYYTNGFTTNIVELVGARYTAPLTTNKVLQITGGILTLTGGNLPDSHTNNFTLGASSKTVNGGPNAMTLTFTPASGLFKGSLTPTNVVGAKAIAFAGAVLQKATNGAGFYLGTNQSGAVNINPQP